MNYRDNLFDYNRNHSPKIKQRLIDKGFSEREVIAYLKSWNPKLKQDGYGNLYLINPGTPLLNAHMDTVQSKQCVDNLKSLRLVK